MVVASFLGPLHRSLDTVSIIRPVAGLLCLIGVVVARNIWFKLYLSSVSLLSFVTVLWFFIPQNHGGDLRIYSKNLWFANSQITSVVRDIEASGVDVVMLQEVSTRNMVILSMLKGDFPYQHLCPFSNWSGIALASRHPFDGDPICSQWRALAAAPIRLSGERVWIVSMHLAWPWPFASGESEVAADTLLSELDGKVVIAGDFNTVPWSARANRISVATKTKIAGPARFTLTYRHVPLPIDFAMSPGGGYLERRDFLGSDHAGIIADLKL